MARTAAVVLVCAFASGATASPEAEGLFRDGRTAMRERQFERACDLFARSQALEPNITTLLNLGSCQEELGRTATAWETFLRARALATEHADKRRADEADRRAARLFPRLARLSIEVPADRQVAGLAIRRDGTPVAPAAWNVGVPIDPGSHRIEVSAPGYRSWSTTFDVIAGKPTVVTVMALVAEPVDLVEIVRPAPPATGKRTREFARTAAGGVLVGAGNRENTLLGVRAVGNMPVFAGYLRWSGSLHRTVYRDHSLEDGDPAADLYTRNLAFTVATDYVQPLASRFAVSAGFGIGLDFDQPRNCDLRDRMIDPCTSDLGSYFMLRLTPAVVALLEGRVEASMQLQLVVSGDELVAAGVIGVDWFAW